MNTRKKTMHTKREESDNGEDNLGFCNQSLRMHIFSSFLQGLVCPRFIFLPFTEAFMMPLNPQIIFHRSFL